MLGNAINLYIKLMLILLITILVCGCSSQQEKLVGKYNSVNSGSTNLVPASLELSADGKGFWSIETDNAPFRWDLHQNYIHLHTKSGGVIKGIVDQDIIQLTLPGIGLIRFQRIP